MILRIMDISASILLLLAVWNVYKSKNWWIVYCVGTILFIIVVISKGLIGMTFMGFALLITGIKNYFVKNKQKIENSHQKK